MWRTTWRSLLAHKLRLALSGLAIVLGVAFVVGTLIFTDTLSKTFNDLFESTAADVNVTRAAAFEQGLEGTGTGGTATYVPAELVDEIADVEGVGAVEGNVQAEGVYILDADGEVLDTGGAPGIGISWDTEESLSPTTLVDGRAATGPGELMIDTNAAEETGYQVGDTITVLTPGPRIEAELVGTFRFGDEGGLAGATLTAFDTETAQELLTAPGQFTGIGVGAADGVDPDELSDRVAAAVGSDYDVKTASEQAESLSSDFGEALQFINIFLLVFAGIALFVGTFIILNTFSMLVAQRTRELALLRALGASRGQVTRSVLGEALVVGLIGSTLGLAAGYGIAAGLRALFGSFGLTLDGSLVLATDTVLWGYAVGVLVTLVSAYVPARRAARMPPVAAMRDDVTTAQRGLRRRVVVGAVLAAAGIAALVGGIALGRRQHGRLARRTGRSRADPGGDGAEPGAGRPLPAQRGRAAAPDLGHDGAAGAGERRPQPAAHGRDGLRPHDRPGAGERVQRHRGVDQRQHRQADRGFGPRRVHRLQRRRPAVQPGRRGAGGRRRRRRLDHAAALGSGPARRPDHAS